MTKGDDELAGAIMAASRALVALTAVSMDAAPTEVTLGQFRMLVVLSTHGPRRMSGLAAEIGLSPSSATRMVERLERKRLVTRRHSPSSRRSIDLHLTPEGAELVRVVMDVRQREVRAVIRALPEDERHAIRSAFEQFARAAGEPTANLTEGSLSRTW